MDIDLATRRDAAHALAVPARPPDRRLRRHDATIDRLGRGWAARILRGRKIVFMAGIRVQSASRSRITRVMHRSNQTPAQLGYRMPAEWEPHAATWLSWPRRDGISFPGTYDQVLPVLAKMVVALADSELVRINVARRGAGGRSPRAALPGPARRSGAGEISSRADERAVVPRPRPDLPDRNPAREHKLVAIDWEYNAWGWKYPPFDLDDAVPSEDRRPAR